MRRAIRVYQGSLDGRHSFCIATTSLRRVATLATMQGFNVSVGYLGSYWTVTGNKAQIEAAMSQPGVLFRNTRPDGGTYLPYDDAHTKLGYKHAIEMREIRDSLDDQNLSPVELHFKSIEIYEARHKNDETYKQRSERMRDEARARYAALPRSVLNAEEIAYLIDKLQGVNDPVGISAREVLERNQ